MQRQHTLWVINHNADPHEDRYDGEDYFFPYCVPVEIPVEGANLMFGYGEDSKVSTLMRSGSGAPVTVMFESPMMAMPSNDLLWSRQSE